MTISLFVVFSDKNSNMSDLDQRLASKTNRFNTEELLRIENDKRYKECLDMADSDADRTDCAEGYPAAANRVKVAKEEAEKKKKQQLLLQQQQQQSTPQASQAVKPDEQTKSIFSNVLNALLNKKTKPNPTTSSDFLKILLGDTSYTYDSNNPPEELENVTAVFQKLQKKVQAFSISLDKSAFLGEVDHYIIDS